MFSELQFVVLLQPNGYHRDLVLTESQRAQKLKNQQLENARGPGFYGIPKLNDNLLKGGSCFLNKSSVC